MKTRIPLMIMSLMAIGLIAMLSAFTNTPSSAQNPTSTPDELQRRATEIVAGATLTAQVGGDFTSVGTSTPLAGLCNSMMYRDLSDIEFLIENALATIPLAPIPDGIQVLLLEETQDCVTFQSSETQVTIAFPARSLEEILDESLLGDRVATVLSTLVSQAPLDILTNATITLSVVFGNQTRQFEMTWQDIRLMGLGDDSRGAELISQITLLGIDVP